MTGVWAGLVIMVIGICISDATMTAPIVVMSAGATIAVLSWARVRGQKRAAFKMGRPMARPKQ